LEESNFGVKEIVEPGAGKHGKMQRKHLESEPRLIDSTAKHQKTLGSSFWTSEIEVSHEK
jgi:hypothetical protein